MKNMKQTLAAFLVGTVVGLTAPKVVNYLGSLKPEQTEVTRGTYQSYSVEVRKEDSRSVVILTDTNKPYIVVHGEDRGNNGSIDMAEPVMGRKGTSNDLSIVQAAYNSVRKK